VIPSPTDAMDGRGLRRGALARIARPAAECDRGPGTGYLCPMAPWDDEDDWVGTPPEGRISRDRARPEYWRGRWPLAGAGLIVVVLLLVIVIIVH
jgi:hypothetical protein